MSEVKNGNNYVGIKMFGIIISILMALIMGAYTLAANAMNKANDGAVIDAALGTNIENLTEDIKEIKADVKSLLIR